MSRKQKQKVYHGIPLTPKDEHTLYYSEYLESDSLSSMPTGYGGITNANPFFVNIDKLNGLTFDFWIKTEKVSSTSMWFNILNLYKNGESSALIQLICDQSQLFLIINGRANYILKLTEGETCHYRYVFKDLNIYIYKNGKQVNNNTSNDFKISEIGYLKAFNGTNPNSKIYLSDLHISSIDRGNYFQSLPQDFIDGKAIIKPRMGQQQIKGDPLYSQETILDVIRPSLDNTYEVVNQVAQANGYYQSLISPELSYSHRTTSWTSGGFKIKGINGELISGITSNGNSPIVTTIDGQVVNGTWSGLGTNEATFSLTSNSGIMSKDLRVIYVLNIPNNNSDFTIMPYSILKVYNSVGDELPLVSDLIITDNFKNRLNYNSVKTTQYATLKTPKEFTDEISDVGYRCLDTNNDDNTFNYASTSPNVKAQNLLSFNLINIIEDAFCGKIPSTDKIGWVKDNVDNVEIFVVGYGNSSTGNRLGITGWCNSENRWYTDIIYHTSSTLNTISYRFHNYDANKWFNKSIDTNGCLHVNVFAENSDASTQSETNLDYAYITIKMKYDVNFKVYAKNNIYARWNNCNPVLVQSETKTITRYFSSNENFVTESLVYTNNKPGDDIKHNLLLQPPFYYATTMGTGTYNTGSDFYRECLAKLGFDAQSYNFNNSFIQNSIDNKTSSIKIVRGVTQSFSSDTHWSIPYKLETPENCMYLIPSLVNIDNQLCIRLVYREISQSGSTSNKGVKIYKLPNRPLIK